MSESQFEDIGSSFIRVSSIENQFHDYREEIKDLNLQIDGLVESKNQMIKEMKKYVLLIQEKDRTIDSMGRHIFVLSGQILAIEEKYEQAKEDFGQQQKRIKELLEQKVNQTDQQINASHQLYGEVAKYEQIIKQLQIELDQAKQQVSIRDKFLTQKNFTIVQLQARNQLLFKEVEGLNNKISQSQLKTQKQPNHSQNQREILQKTANGLERLLKSTQQPSKDLQASPVSQTQQLLAMIEKYEDEKKQLLNKFNYMELQIIDRKKKCGDLELTLKQMEENQAQKANQPHQNQKSDLEQLYNQVLDQQQRYELEIKQIKAKLESKSAQFDEEVRNSSKFAQEIVQMNNEIESLRNFTAQLNKKIQDLTKQKDQLIKGHQSLLKQTRNLQQNQFQKQKSLEQEKNYLIALNMQFKENEIKYNSEIDRLTQLRDSFQLKQIEKIIKVYLNKVINNIKTMKLSQKDQKVSISTEFKRLEQMKNDAFKMFPEDYRNLRINNKKSSENEELQVKGCFFSK